MGAQPAPLWPGNKDSFGYLDIIGLRCNMNWIYQYPQYAGFGCFRPMPLKKRFLGAGWGPGAIIPNPGRFYRAFVLGEGEEIILEIVETVKEARKGGLGKGDTLAKLAAIPGIYVPKFYSPAYDANGVYRGLKPLGDFPPLKKRIVNDFGSHPLPRKLVVPLVQPVHDRVSIEICRGCARGCRFCQAGMLYRPVRERPEAAGRTGNAAAQNTGSSKPSFFLSSADYCNRGAGEI